MSPWLPVTSISVPWAKPDSVDACVCTPLWRICNPTVHRLSMTKLTPQSKFRTSNFPTGDNTLNLQWTFELGLDVLHRPMAAGISVRPRLNRYLLIYTENEMEHLYSKSLHWRSNHRDMLIRNDPYHWRLDYEDIKRAVSACMGVGYDFNWLPDQSIWNSAQLMWSFSTFIMLKLLSQAKHYFAGHVMPAGVLNWIKNNDWKVFILVYGQVHKQYQSGPYGPD